ncbi:S-adenosylmethionine:tRNA ribosyltransferase-isomerase [Nostoc sp. FACHB-892]|uniref:S-adenosylmethionine:tRNA ribosyltransferase-isomerase n=1 Tax=Nostoc sp. FACHB-892 TaxID=2692843 RepID=UPI0016840CB2|nr:S-adenosylmethionine:tRNA ribosyltransferase-isomerase [Nostoc sp. FACHB-892]MBD2731945.1 S-adenosylmethionine:tRNA ribosyltransferase-isomerase [Nostoc sp. FACHB-892]
MSAPFSFVLPSELSAKEPPEQRGIPRDAVRLMVIDHLTKAVNHTQFNQLGTFLRPGDLLVFNSSRTLPAVLASCETSTGECLQIRLAHHLSDGSWLALLICQNGEPFTCGLRSGMQIQLNNQLSATVGERDPHIPRLWKLRFSQSGSELIQSLYRIGQPIRYEYVSAPWALDAYQTVYAREPGSAEMPSAGRAFTWQLLFNLKRVGIDMTQIVLHTGLSSYLDDDLDAQHPASEEEYLIPEVAATKINQTRRAGGRIIAVGTTVVRALESVVDERGIVMPGHGYTRLHITATHKLKAADGLLTGLHEPQASHLDLLTAFLPASVIHDAYENAVQMEYLWHEFGDLNLII